MCWYKIFVFSLKQILIYFIYRVYLTWYFSWKDEFEVRDF